VDINGQERKLKWLSAWSPAYRPGGQRTCTSAEWIPDPLWFGSPNWFRLSLSGEGFPPSFSRL